MNSVFVLELSFGDQKCCFQDITIRKIRESGCLGNGICLIFTKFSIVLCCRSERGCVGDMGSTGTLCYHISTKQKSLLIFLFSFNKIAEIVCKF